MASFNSYIQGMGTLTLPYATRTKFDFLKIANPGSVIYILKISNLLHHFLKKALLGQPPAYKNPLLLT